MNKYWIGGNGTYSDVNHWSNASGGDHTDSVPSFEDTIIFDNNSGNEALTIILDGDINANGIFSFNRNKSFKIINANDLDKLPDWNIKEVIKLNEYCTIEDDQGDLKISDNCIIHCTGNFKNLIDETGNIILLDSDITFKGDIVFRNDNSVLNIQNDVVITANTIIPVTGVNINANRSTIILNSLNNPKFRDISFNPSSSKLVINNAGVFNSGNSKFNEIIFKDSLQIKDNIICNIMRANSNITLNNTFIRILDDIFCEGTISSNVNSVIDMNGNHIKSMMILEGVSVTNGSIKRGQNIQLSNNDSDLFPITLAENILMKNGESMGTKLTDLEKSVQETKKREIYYAMKLKVANEEGAIVNFEDLDGIDESSMSEVEYDEVKKTINFSNTEGSIKLKELEVDPYEEIEVEIWSDIGNDSFNIKEVDNNSFICDCDDIPVGVKVMIDNHIYTIERITLND